MDLDDFRSVLETVKNCDFSERSNGFQVNNNDKESNPNPHEEDKGGETFRGLDDEQEEKSSCSSEHFREPPRGWLTGRLSKSEAREDRTRNVVRERSEDPGSSMGALVSFTLDRSLVEH
ncbi:hypothetical protein V6N13_095259 [Hibiscus sabdariffa]|uniref:Uncharacterized protein n=1 Tax=Hibiscus sabdariffa TaxID=183260 RepID=A0ABR2PS91_9ROSI